MQIQVPDSPRSEIELDNSNTHNIRQPKILPQYIRKYFGSDSIDIIWGSCDAKVNDHVRKARIFAINPTKLCLFSDSDLRYELMLKQLSHIYISYFYSDILLVWKSKEKAIIIDSPLENRKQILRLGRLGNKLVIVKTVKGTILDIEQRQAIKNFGKEEKEEQFGELDEINENENDEVFLKRLVSGNKVMNLSSMKKKFMEKKQNLGVIDKFAEFEFLSELLTNQFWKSYLAKPRVFKAGLTPKNKNKIVSSENAQTFTIKVYPKEKLAEDEGLLQFAIKEAMSLQQIISPYVPNLKKIFITEGDFVLVHDFFDGLLINELFEQQKNLKEQSLLRMLIAEIVVAVGQIHECGFVYGDLSPKNIMLNHDGHIMLIGIGTCQKPKEAIIKPCKICSPEELKNNESQKICDWWCLGLLLFEILAHRSYFDKYEESEAMKQILNEKEELKLNLNVDYKEKSILDLIQKLLIKDKNRRLGGKNDYHEVLNHPFFQGIEKKQLINRNGKIIKKLKVKESKEEIEVTKGRPIRMVDDMLEKCLYTRDLL